MLIGLGHQAQVGKDTIGQILVEQHGFTRVAFADELKEMALDVDPVVDFRHSSHDPYDVHPIHLASVVGNRGWEVAKQNPVVRRHLQNLGSALRIRDANFWLNRAFEKMHLDGGDYVITDVRYRNEARAIKDVHGFVIDVTRPGVEPAGLHPSEHDLDDWPFDIVLANDGTIERLERRVRLMLPLLRRRAAAV